MCGTGLLACWSRKFLEEKETVLNVFSIKATGYSLLKDLSLKSLQTLIYPASVVFVRTHQINSPEMIALMT